MSGDERVAIHSLRPNAVGTVGIVFSVLAFAAPLAAIAGVAPIVFGAAGSEGAPGVYAVCTLVLIVFSVGFAAMSRQHSGPGGFAVYIARAFGSRSGFGASFVAILGYNAFLSGNLGLFGYIMSQLFEGKFSLDIPWWVFSLGAAVVMCALGYREIDLSVKVLGVLLVIEMAIIGILDAATLIRGGYDGINFDGFTFHAISSGAPGIVFLLAFACFVGFEATTLYGEEARDRHRTIPRATYIAVLVVGVFYTLVMWVFQIGYGTQEAARIATEDPGNFMFAINTEYVGAWSTNAMEWLVATSIFAAVLSMHNALSRYLFALGRNGALPSSIGTPHERHRSPHRANIVQTAVTALIVGLFAICGADPYVQLYAWLVGIGSVSILVLYMVSSLAVGFVLRSTNGENRRWVTTIAPALSFIAMGFFTWLAIHNYEALTGSTSPVVNHLWLLVPIVALAGAALTRGIAFQPTAADQPKEHA
jgi:amino acid transporter